MTLPSLGQRCRSRLGRWSAGATGKLSEPRLPASCRRPWTCAPAAFRRYLDLHRPIFQKTTAYGQFGREDADFTWERTDRADQLREAAGLGAKAEASA